jgi:hypothetical protein
MTKNKLILSILSIIIASGCISGQSVPYRLKNLWGLSDLKGNLVSQVKYDSIEFIIPRYKMGKIWKANRIGYINETGKEILAPVYDDVNDESKYLKVKNNNKKGIFNYQGNCILPVQYDELETVYNNFIILTKNSKKGIARFENNKVVIKKKPTFDKLNLIYPGDIFECEIKGKKQYFDTLIKPVKYDSTEVEFATMDDFMNGGGISMEELQNAINEREFENNKYLNRNKHKENIVLKRDSSSFSIIYERKNGLWGVRKCNGTILVPYKYDDIDIENTNLQDFHSGYRQLYVLKYNGQWGMIGHKNRDAKNYNDTTSYKLIDFKFDSIYCNINCTFYFLRENNKLGIISAKYFKNIIQPKYLYIRNTYDERNGESIFWVQTINRKFGYINENGIEYFKDE